MNQKSLNKLFETDFRKQFKSDFWGLLAEMGVDLLSFSKSFLIHRFLYKMHVLRKLN